MQKGLKAVIGAVLAIVAMIFAGTAASVQAQTFNSIDDIIFTTGFQVQNLSGNSEANIEVLFYDGAGAQEGQAFTDTIPANESRTYFPLDGAQIPLRPSVPEGFEGSAVISSDVQVAAILNILGGEDELNNQRYGGSVLGLTGGSTTVGLPLVQTQPNAFFETWFAIQNAGDAEASVTVDFIPAGVGNAGQVQATIPPGAASIVSTEDATLAGIADENGRFVGSVSITSNVPVVAAVSQTGGIGGGQPTLLSYGGFSSDAGGTSLFLPLVQNANAGFFSGLSIQNVSDSEVTVTLEYGTNGVNQRDDEAAFQPTNPEPFTLAPGETRAINTSLPADRGGFGGNDRLQFRYVGGATVSATGNVVAVVNQLNQQGISVGSSYNGSNASAATNNVSAPLILSTRAFFTGMQCQNVGDATASVDVTFGANTFNDIQSSDPTFTPPAFSSPPLEPGATFTLLQSQAALGIEESVQYRGSASITSAQPVVCIVNQLVSPATAGDQFLTYEGASFE